MRVAVVTALARFRHENRDAFDGIIPRIVGIPRLQKEENEANSSTDSVRCPLVSQLELLRESAMASRPAVKAVELVNELVELLEEWEREGRRIVELRRAAAALRPFTRFPDLVKDQVAGLIADLANDTEGWVGRIYRPHYLGGPGFAGIGGDGTDLDLRASMGGVNAPAHQVLNASALRAHVWGFLFALWERVWAKRGSLSCLLLDDPQALFDTYNAENLAAAVPNMLDVGMAPVIVSNDNHFVAAVIFYSVTATVSTMRRFFNSRQSPRQSSLHPSCR